MKILFVHTKYLQSAGGEDTTFEAEVELMKSKGHDVNVLIFDNANMDAGIAGKLKTGIKAIYNSASARKMKKEVVSFKPDIVHIHNFFFAASPSVIIEASKLKVPVVVTLHNFRLVCASALLLRNNKICELCINHSFPWYGIKYKCYHNSAIQSAVVGGMSAIHKLVGTWRNKVDMFITPSSFSRNKLLNSSLDLSTEKIQVKHNFVEDPGIGMPENRKSFYLFVGRISSEKGVDVLLEAWTKIPGKNLIIAGDGPEKEMLTGRFSTLANVEFTGKISRQKVLELMKECKALLFPSVCYEGMPLTITEAFATGTPVIGSALGGMQEMISDGENGFLFEAGNNGQLADAVLKFEQYSDSDNFEMYRNARNSYLRNYTPDQSYQKVMEIYSLAIRKSRNE